MTIMNVQLAESPSLTDYACINVSGTDIPAGTAVMIDATNTISASSLTDGIAVKLPSADGVDGTIGVTMEIIPKATAAAGAVAGRVRFPGPIAVCTASGAVTAGTSVMAESATGKVKTCGAGKVQLGVALTTAADTDVCLVALAVAKNA